MNRYVSKNVYILFIAICFVFSQLSATTYLKERFSDVKSGDYIVAAINQTYAAVMIKDKKQDVVTIEEFVVPQAKLALVAGNWLQWMSQGANGATSHVEYKVDIKTGQMIEYYSHTLHKFLSLSESDNFLSKLLNLKLDSVPKEKWKKVGPQPPEGARDTRRYWFPKVHFFGKATSDVKFEVLCTKWPKDNSEMSGRSILIYLPSENQVYPAYFPYWLEIQGIIGKAKVRVIDSGSKG